MIKTKNREKYLKELEERNGKKITEINFRDKTLSWKNLQLTLETIRRNRILQKEVYQYEDLEIQNRDLATQNELLPEDISQTLNSFNIK